MVFFKKILEEWIRSVDMNIEISMEMYRYVVYKRKYYSSSLLDSSWNYYRNLKFGINRIFL